MIHVFMRFPTLFDNTEVILNSVCVSGCFPWFYVKVLRLCSSQVDVELRVEAALKVVVVFSD